MTTPLPIADSATRAWFEDWLHNFAGYVRTVDYDAAKRLWHPDVIAFSTHEDVVQGLEQYVSQQWRNVWPRTAEFQFDVEKACILTADDDSVVVIVVTWTSTGFDPDGAPFARPGRATLVFHRDEEGWNCVHVHMSFNRGVKQESFGRRSAEGRAAPRGGRAGSGRPEAPQAEPPAAAG